MKLTRTNILMLILLVLLGGYLLKPILEPRIFSMLGNPEEKGPPPLLGTNDIRSIKVTQEEGTYYADITYFYTGEPSNATIGVFAQDSNQKTVRDYTAGHSWKLPIRGENTIKLEINRPIFSPNVFATNRIVARLGSVDGGRVQKEIDLPIEWLDGYSYRQHRELYKKSIDELYKEAVDLIDQSTFDSLALAKKYLDRIILKNPQYVDAYPEYARVSMKTNWGPEGLYSAEQYLKNALKIQSNHANSRVLLGYVYTHQKRFNEAELEFIEAEKIGTGNLWLWVNWGQKLSFENKIDQSVEKYMKAVTAPRTYNTYDKARLEAYEKLLFILSSTSNLSKMDELHRKRVSEFKLYPCFHSDYAAFKIYKEGDYQNGIDEAKLAIDGGCSVPYAREILGISNYLAWSQKKGEDKDKYLSEAQVFLPESPRLFYLLSKGQKTTAIIKDLVGSSSKIDLKDNDKLNALAYSVIENDIAAARRLIRLGANVTGSVGHDDYPIALIPIIKESEEGIQIMLEKGIDYTQVKYKGMSGLEYAKQKGNQKILSLIQSKAKQSI